MGDPYLMKNRILAIFIILFLLIGSINVIALNSDNDKMFTFSETSILVEDNYIKLQISESDTLLDNPGEPMLPVYTKTYVFPFGTKIFDVKCIPGNIIKQEINAKIKPAAKPVQKMSINSEDSSRIFINEQVYKSNDLYPDNWFTYDITCGRNNDKIVVFLTVQMYPIRYSPSNNMLYKTDFDIKIDYVEPEIIKTTAEDYDMVIIAPNKFSRQLQDLVDHKNDYGVKTFLKTTEEIYDSYEGRDKAEKIKYFIKDAIETKNISYVMLAGGRVGQLQDWYVPVRYSNMEDPGFEMRFLSDLYFADIYKYNQSSHEIEFEDWDNNSNGIFAEWSDGSYWQPEDELDLVPDIYIGRLACRNKIELGTVIDKIITYETNTYGKDWFKNMILVGGDTVPSSSENSYEGEIETNLGGSHLGPLGFSLTKLWTSTGTLSTPYDFIDALNEGAGFLFLSGHGNPRVWSTHLPNSDEWVDIFSKYMKYLRNKEKLPVCVVGGCHNNQFDVAVTNFILGLKHEKLDYFNSDISATTGGFWKVEWSDRCWSWDLVSKKNGGTIATIGNTGLGFGYSGPGCVNALDGWITSHFFENYANLSVLGNNTLGEIHGQTVIDYVHTFIKTSNYWDQSDVKTVQGWALLGDPSLYIGGYPSS